MKIEGKLASHLKKFITAPFLFIGSGFPGLYLGMEDWEGLIQRFSELVPKAFGYYRYSSNSEWDVVVRMISGDFHEVWWNENQYKDSRRILFQTIKQKE